MAVYSEILPARGYWLLAATGPHVVFEVSTGFTTTDSASETTSEQSTMSTEMSVGFLFGIDVRTTIAESFTSTLEQSTEKTYT